MLKYFGIIILIILIQCGKSSAQMDTMSSEELKERAERMGYSEEDYLKLQQLKSSQKEISRNEKKGDSDKVVLPKYEPFKSYSVKAFSKREDADSLPAFGYKIFSSQSSSFLPLGNVPVPTSYIIGPGDEIIISLWGETQLEYNLEVSKDGNIFIPNAGLVNVNGLSLSALRKKIFNVLSKTYSSLISSEGSEAKTNLYVSTGNLRSVKVFVLGEVRKPGAYTLPSLSTSFTSLYFAGGPTLDGTLRNIKVLRDGETISVIDLYDYLISGDKSKDVKLKDEDIIFVPPVGERAAITGEVFRPAVYELKENETLKDLLKYSGGLNFNAYFQRVHIERIIPFEQRKEFENNILDIDLNFSAVDEMRNSNYGLDDGDIVSILAIDSLFENRVKISGAVGKPGIYELSNNLMTVRDLIYNADSLNPDAFREKAILIRTLPSEKKEIFSFNVDKALNGNPEDNIILKNRDEVKVYSKIKFFPARTVEILGAVENPGTYTRYENMTLTDLIILAGGLTDSATTSNIEIARMDTSDETTFARKYIVSLKKDYWNTVPENDFLLDDYDRVLIKRDPAKIFNKTITIAGEVQFPGKYTLLKEDEKVYDVIKRAGGFKKTAYTAGIFVYRKNKLLKGIQRDIIPDTLRKVYKDIPIYDERIINEEYSNRIPILWDNILEDTSSVYNIPIEPRDSIIIPKNPNVIYVLGEVGIPSSVPYQEGEGLSYYIDQAGGYTENSGEGYEIVILPNGKKWSPSYWFFIPDPEILSGSTVVVPTLIESASNFWPIVRDAAAFITSTAVLILTIKSLTK